MKFYRLPTGVRPAPLPSSVAFQFASACPAPPSGDGWIYEVKHDGHRIAALADGKGGLRLLSRNEIDRTARFAAAVDGLAGLGRSFVIDGEIAAPDERGVTHLDDLAEAIGNGRTERLAYFAFDLLYLDGHDLRPCPLVERKAMLAELLVKGDCNRVLYVDHIEHGAERLLDGVRQAGGEGIVAKRAAGRYRAGPSREWRKTKCSATGAFVVTGYRESAPGTLIFGLTGNTGL
jgi:bifunctional non-homologous end joining protein LigD